MRRVKLSTQQYQYVHLCPRETRMFQQTLQHRLYSHTAVSIFAKILSANLLSAFSSNERPCLSVSVSLSAQFKVHEYVIQKTEGVSFLCETNVIECLPASHSILCTPNLTFSRPFLPSLFLPLAFCFANVRTEAYSCMFSVEHAIQFIACILQKGIHVLHFNFQQ